MFNRYFIRCITTVVLFSTAFAGLSDEIVLVVGDQVVTRSEFEVEKSFFIKANHVTFANKTQRQQFEQDFAKMHAETMLQLVVGQNMSISLDKDDLDLVKREMLSRHGVKSEDDFKALLSSKGVDYHMFMKQAERQYLLKKIHGYVLGSRIRLSEKEIDKIYDTELSKQNLLYVEDVFYSTEHTVKKNHLAIKEKSQRVSDDWKKRTFSANTVPKKSKMLTFKWQPLDALPSQFRDVITKMQVGDVSDPIETDNGYHVLKLIKKKLPANVRLEKDQIKQKIFVERMSVELPKWLDELRDQTYIKIYLDSPE